MDRTIGYINEVGLSEKDNDSLWFVVDVDKWKKEQLDKLAEYCKEHDNWHIVVSNPCFEIWLLYHKHKDISKLDCSTPTATKQTLHQQEKGGYFYLNYLPLLNNAIENAKNNDADKKHYFPDHKQTKVYQLGEAILSRIGVPRFEKFISEYLPTLKLSRKKQV